MPACLTAGFLPACLLVYLPAALEQLEQFGSCRSPCHAFASGNILPCRPTFKAGGAGGDLMWPGIACPVKLQNVERRMTVCTSTAPPLSVLPLDVCSPPLPPSLTQATAIHPSRCELPSAAVRCNRRRAGDLPYTWAIDSRAWDLRLGRCNRTHPTTTPPSHPHQSLGAPLTGITPQLDDWIVASITRAQAEHLTG